VTERRSASLARWAQWLAHLTSLGVTFSVTRLPELSITAFRDPDNIQIELCAAHPSPTRSAIDDTGRLVVPLDDG
jgi:hypothetical protein